MTEICKRMLSSVFIVLFIAGLWLSFQYFSPQLSQLAWFVVIAIVCFLMGFEWKQLIKIDSHLYSGSSIFFALLCVLVFGFIVLLLKYFSVESVLISFISALLLTYVVTNLLSAQGVLKFALPSSVNHISSYLSHGFGMLYIGTACASFFLIFITPEGAINILFLVLCVSIADTAAYVGGKCWGKRKLCPKISPGKTWFGAFTGIFAALVFYLLLAMSFSDDLRLSVGMALFVICIVIFSIVGDLFISVLKRRSGRKDSGKIIPGHGGVLDRLDGHMFVYVMLLPLVLWEQTQHSYPTFWWSIL